MKKYAVPGACRISNRRYFRIVFKGLGIDDGITGDVKYLEVVLMEKRSRNIMENVLIFIYPAKY